MNQVWLFLSLLNIKPLIETANYSFLKSRGNHRPKVYIVLYLTCIRHLKKQSTYKHSRQFIQHPVLWSCYTLQVLLRSSSLGKKEEKL